MLQRFDSAALPATPWKNGGGSTREVVCWPPGASLDAFDWRVSIASIEAPGPFSAFAGIDRNITLLTGAGVQLHSADGAMNHRLGEPFTPFAFAGDVPLDCTLLGGASTDFNVMTRRGKLHADVHAVNAVSATTSVTLAPAGLLLAARGSWRVQSPDGTHELAPGQGLWWASGARGALILNPSDAGAILLSVAIHPAP